MSRNSNCRHCKEPGEEIEAGWEADRVNQKDQSSKMISISVHNQNTNTFLKNYKYIKTKKM